MGSEASSKAFLAQVSAHQNIVHKVSMVYGNAIEDREDLKQEILLQLWKSWASFDGRSAFSTWMYRVALNTAISFRRRKRRPPADPDISWQHDVQYQDAAHAQDLKRLYQAISGLSAVEKAIILLWLDERSYDEIADTLGTSVKNVSVRLVRIRSKLTRLIREAD
ncbi:MAG: sigma-70 family RNA polymerase sigma factor [Lysobacterales bacterium]|jgi:RNA polymerase sigma-70 factor (ECF subfamily)